MGYQMESDWSVVDQERQAISFLKENKNNHELNVSYSKRFRLGNLPARRFKAQYLRNGKAMITDQVVALYKGVEYELMLHTEARRYAADKIQFQKVIASWRLTPRV